MATQIFEDVIFGPINSRRLGVSLGINLMPINGKLCNFDCIYCECGWNTKGEEKLRYTPKDVVFKELNKKLEKMAEKGEKLDVITFAGNGEPTMHPHFDSIIDMTIELRDKFFADTKIAVLSNSTQIIKERVRKTLEKVDRAILKIDSVIDKTIELVNQPQFKYTLKEVVDSIKLFNGEIIIQTMFLRGEYKGERIDNTSDNEIEPWLKVLKDIKPSLVMIYSLDRDTPLSTLEKVNAEDLNKIAEKVKMIGIDCTISA